MKDFLRQSQETVDRGRLKEEERARFKRVLEYRNRHDDIEQKAGFDLTNLENLFGLVDLNARVEPEAALLRDDFVFLILRTLEATIRKEKLEPCQVPCRMPGGQRAESRNSSVSEHFVDIVAQRWGAPEPTNGLVRHSIISLNYDLVIEQAMLARNLRPVYCLRCDPAVLLAAHGVEIKLLKLHPAFNQGYVSHLRACVG